MANFTCYDYAGRVMSQLYQWDTNMTVAIHGVQCQSGSTVYLHFCNRLSTTAYVVQPEVSIGDGAEDKIYTATIPNELLRQPDNIMMYVSEQAVLDMNAVIDSLRVVVIPRIKPDDYIYIPNEDAVYLAQGLELNRGRLYLTTSSGDQIGNSVGVNGASTPMHVTARINKQMLDVEFKTFEQEG